MPAKCALGCKTNVYPMHVFPNPEKDPERFKAWLDVLGDDTPLSLTDDQIFRRLKICDKHFIYEHRARFNRLSAVAVPYRNLPASSVVETEPEVTNKSEPIKTDNVEEEGTVEIYAIMDESDSQVAAKIDIKIVSSDDDATEIPSPATSETDCIHPNGPYTKSPLEDDFLPQSTPAVMNIDDADRVSHVPCTSSYKVEPINSENRSRKEYTPETAEHYHKRWPVAQKLIQKNQLNIMRKKNANNRSSEKRALEIVTKNMRQPAKLFLAMQMKNQTNPVFTMDEKKLSLSIYRKSPECYKLLSDYFVLPSSRIMQSMNLESRLHEFNRRNGRYGI